jgi:hypothetical protein
MPSYNNFLDRKAQYRNDSGFEPLWIPDFLYGFQSALVEWALRRGRALIAADCGLGKTPMQLVWAQNVVQKTNKPILILTPLGVSAQTKRESEKFGIEAQRSKDGKFLADIVITNYESLHHFNAGDFIGCVCDESSCLKNFDGKRKAEITEFMRRMPYRLCCTATAAPNDYIELGTTSEALGQLGHMDMLGRFFKNDQNTVKPMIYRHRGMNFAQLEERNKWRFKKHAEIPFWRWVCSWARALRRPSDLGFEDDGFILPDLIERETIIKTDRRLPGELFIRPAVGLKEQRQERRVSMNERCEKVVELCAGSDYSVIWCHLNEEGNLLEKIIPDSVQISGQDSDDRKENVFVEFANGNIKNLITKPKIGGFGLNWPHCNHETFFPSHSYEQYYQGVRRCWRFGQKRPVTIDVVTTEGELDVLKNLQRKSEAADRMFSNLVAYMNDVLKVDNASFLKQEEVPTWL